MPCVGCTWVHSLLTGVGQTMDRRRTFPWFHAPLHPLCLPHLPSTSKQCSGDAEKTPQTLPQQPFPNNPKTRSTITDTQAHTQKRRQRLLGCLLYPSLGLSCSCTYHGHGCAGLRSAMPRNRGTCGTHVSPLPSVLHASMPPWSFFRLLLLLRDCRLCLDVPNQGPNSGP